MTAVLAYTPVWAARWALREKQPMKEEPPTPYVIVIHHLLMNTPIIFRHLFGYPPPPYPLIGWHNLWIAPKKNKQISFIRNLCFFCIVDIGILLKEFSPRKAIKKCGIIYQWWMRPPMLYLAYLSTILNDKIWLIQTRTSNVVKMSQKESY